VVSPSDRLAVDLLDIGVTGDQLAGGVEVAALVGDDSAEEVAEPPATVKQRIDVPTWSTP
jgi:hypothetical protein